MKAQITQPSRSRIYYFDVLRFVACMAVIMIHTTAIYTIKDFGSFNFWVANVLGSVVRFAVPVFVMISGSLMLDENYEFTKEKWLRHIKKMVVFFLFWSAACVLFYQILRPVMEHRAISLAEAVTAFAQGATHLWFVFMIIGLYLILPLLRLWVKRENKKQIEYFIALSMIFVFLIPQIVRVGALYSNAFEVVRAVVDKLNLKYVGGYTTYFILGWYLNNYQIKNKKMIYALGALCLAVTVFATEIIAKTTGNSDIMYEALTINVLLYSVMIFVLVKSLVEKSKPEKQSSLILGVSKYSLGIYGIHPLVISIASTLLTKLGIDVAIVSIPVIFAISLVASFAISFVMSKLPLLKKVV